VVSPNGDTWKITATESTDYWNVSPVIYTKVAFSFLALYNSTYARDMVVYLEQILPYPTKGYCDGSIYGGGVGNMASDVGCNTNSLILDAAFYAIHNNS